MELDSTERERYARQLVLKEIGNIGQKKMKNACVYVVGAGGLGSSLLLYLAAAGVGKLVIIDGDTVQLNNLQRQVIFNQNLIGMNKALAAQVNLENLNKNIVIEAVPEFITNENIINIINTESLIADCSDNFKTRYLINDFAIKNDCTLISAAIYKHQIQFGVFNHLYAEGKRSATFSCAFPKQENENMEDTCAQSGVMGITPGMGGMLMANEIIKIITSSIDVQFNKMMVFDMHTLSLKHWQIKRKEGI